MELTPVLVLAMWASGLAAGAAAVGWWRIVGPGYLWLTAGLAAAVGVLVIATGGGPAAWLGTAVAAVAVVAARSPVPASLSLVVAAVAFLVVAADRSPLLAAATGAVLTGGVTSEMLLGHWYLVDPRLPRQALKALTAAAGAGLLADAAVVATRVLAAGNAADPVFGWAYLALTVMTGLLIVAVWLSLDEPRYTGVMAATGLSYLAVLTCFGMVVVGRMVAYG